MKQFFSFVKKEFYHILRDKQTLFILIGMPIVQIILFGFALSNEVKNSKIAVLDMSKDEVTTQIISKLNASRYFEVDKTIYDYASIEKIFRQGKIKLAVVFPAHFAEDLRHFNKASSDARWIHAPRCGTRMSNTLPAACARCAASNRCKFPLWMNAGPGHGI